VKFLREWLQRIANMREVAASRRTTVVFAMRYGREVTLGLIYPLGIWRARDNDNYRRRR
jgi:hypothetical protein